MARPPSASRAQLPDKLFFKIGEVADLVGVRPHVLRYWEGEFRELSPMKTRGSHRMYRRRDVEVAIVIRRLLHDEKFTIAGARRYLRRLRAEEPSAATEQAADAGREVSLRAELLAVRADLVSLLAELDGLAIAAPETAASATVAAVVPARVRVPARRRS